MKKIVLISCVSKKRNITTNAKDLYISPLFIKNLQYAKLLNPNKIYILSAKFGLLNLIDKIKPYNLTLNNMKCSEIKAWAKSVLYELKKVSDIHNDKFIFLAGEKYRKYLIPHLDNYYIPMKGLSIGKQLKWLNERINYE
jgi:cytoplasmic iron level regulating protein YaaA (DUF328/UPF0246 family)